MSGSSKALDEARAEAFADAKRKAEIYARAAGAELGRVMTVSEDGAMPFRYGHFAALAPMSAAPRVAPGDKTLRIGVTVMFELVR